MTVWPSRRQRREIAVESVSDGILVYLVTPPQPVIVVEEEPHGRPN